MHLEVTRNSQILTEEEWHPRRAAYEAQVRECLEPHLRRKARHQKHPVYDFLFEYYHYRPGQMLRWHPGLGILLQGETARPYLEAPGYRLYSENPLIVGADPHLLKAERRSSAAWILTLLKATARRPPFFGCFGLHEWAMVYRCDTIRHESWPLRFSPEAIAAFVESQTVCCSHYDAFRFFTQAARPLNRHQPSKERVLELEQRGCLHANMDLYKWAFKLSPYIPSELVYEAFKLAYDVREVDMRASPYDLRALGFEPIPIETPEGRAQYEIYQRGFSDRGLPIRQRLIELYEHLLHSLTP